MNIEYTIYLALHTSNAIFVSEDIALATLRTLVDISIFGQ